MTSRARVDVPTRVILTQPPFKLSGTECPWQGRGHWPCSWITGVTANDAPVVTAYRCRFRVSRRTTVRVHVTADERYELFLDGERVGRGPERGDAWHWFYETYDLPLSPGRHELLARVSAFGNLAPWAQISLRPGFLLAPQERAWQRRIGTGLARWETRPLTNYRFKAILRFQGPGFEVTGDAWQGPAWRPAIVSHAALDAGFAHQIGRRPLLRPATLPPMMDQCQPIGRVRIGDPSWQALFDGTGSVTVPARTRARVLLDLENYYCGYPELVTRGGAGSTVEVRWAESLYNEPAGRTKPVRSEVAGKHFVGGGDVFRPDGPRRQFEPLWWRAGRYVELTVKTDRTPVVLERFAVRETRYPLEMEGDFAASDPRLAAALPVLVRSAQMCAHETYMDCPYYEQLQYVGDTRIQALITYCLTRDDRLPRKALRLFAASLLPNGLTRSNYPSGGTQIIPPFSLWWVAMLADYARWRNDPALVRELLPAARYIVDTTLRYRNDDGLVRFLPGWNFTDWVAPWRWGEPSGPVSGVLNWQLVLTLRQLAEMETEPELAVRARRLAKEIAARTRAVFWDKRRRLFADDPAHRQFSEQCQALAILAGATECGPALLTATGVVRTSIYFKHYLFEAYRVLREPAALLARLDLWWELSRWDLKTTYESETPATVRSDCHAWGAHPLYHYYATLLGIRPAAPGFARVEIAPQLGPLTWAKGTLPHPRGRIEVELERRGRRLCGTIRLPRGVTGTFVHAGQTRRLSAGVQHVR